MFEKHCNGYKVDYLCHFVFRNGFEDLTYIYK